ncbi:hypothetical protein ABIF96_003065 [Bradyrhizobium ottawaense]|uniref:hypothetical protein n=1 Tax=Bradyrhizobium ottawaense TaxID=931866 RepID=UPI003839357D
MVDVSISIFKDAAEALEKILDVACKLGTAIMQAGKNGVMLFDATTARTTHSKLNAFTADLQEMSEFQQHVLQPTFEKYRKDPTDQNWQRIVRDLDTTKYLLNGVSQLLRASTPALATQPFFKDLVAAFMVRERAFDDILALPIPSTPEETEAALAFLATYDRLIGQLEVTSDALRDYIRSMQSAGTYQTDSRGRAV